MSDTDSGKDKRWRLGLFIQFVGLLIAVIAVAASAYFSLRSEQEKSLAVRYIAKRALMSPSTQPLSNVKVTYNDQDVNSLWLISGRLENVGDQPIKADDIEQTLSLSFDTGRVLGAEIGDTNPDNISAKAIHTQRVVEIEHGLLNRNDWISFDILFDGEDGWPEAAFRISGVSGPLVILPSDEVIEFLPAYFRMARPFEFLILTVPSSIAISLIGIAFFTIGKALRDSISLSKCPARNELSDFS